MRARQAMVERYRLTFTLAVGGDRQRGESNYGGEWVVCRRLGTPDHALGPNLRLHPHRNPESLLSNILDPNIATSFQRTCYMSSATKSEARTLG